MPENEIAKKPLLLFDEFYTDNYKPTKYVMDE